ncbi:MAG TPA: hypothetical protein VNQ90_11195 [Chthoniobacteraceae bacterium]|nr:hypothetical protein [Chthoniobacteraceae bacterium]
MNKTSSVFDHFDKFADRIPSPIRKPLEKEWRPLRDLFLKRRAARLVVVGRSAERFAREHFFGPAPEGESAPPFPPSHGTPWTTFDHQGKLQLVFATGGEAETARNAIATAAPDLFVFLAEGPEPSPEEEALLEKLHRFDRDRHASSAPLVAVCEEDRAAPLSDALHADPALSASLVTILPITQREAILTAIARALPDEARMEFARVTGEKAIQREIASALTRSTTAVCAAIGAQPIPFADLPVLTALQVAMVAGIIQVSGRPWSLATARDFVAALGVNIGAGLALREGTRAAIKLLPGWGNAISGTIAGAGTYALGRASAAYFIEGLPLEEARRRLKLYRSRKAKELADAPPEPPAEALPDTSSSEPPLT